MDYATLRKIALTIKIALAMSWSATALAAAAVAASSTQSEIRMLDPLLVGLAIAVCLLSGATALALRLTALFMDRTPGDPLIRPWLFAAANMGGSGMAGMAAFFMGRANEWGVWTMLLGVLFMSFLGAKAIEILAERWLGALSIPGVSNYGQKPKGDDK